MDPRPHKNRHFLNAIGHAAWSVLSRLALFAGLLLPLGGLAQVTSTAPLLVGFDVDPNSFANRWSTLYFQEAFRRLGLSIRTVHYPLARRTALVDSGEVDIDSGRVHAYGDAHPKLVRVEEPFMAYNFALFTAHPTLQLQSVDSLRSADWLAEYRRGILFCEKALKAAVPAERLSDISSEEQGIHKLLAGRTDLYCDLEYVVSEALRSPGIEGAARVRKALSLGSVPIYTYLQPRHAELAPRLAAVFKQMKSEGLLESYQVQVAREMGRAP